MTIKGSADNWEQYLASPNQRDKELSSIGHHALYVVAMGLAIPLSTESTMSCLSVGGDGADGEDGEEEDGVGEEQQDDAAQPARVAHDVTHPQEQQRAEQGKDHPWMKSKK